jgi:hypothetical protein
MKDLDVVQRLSAAAILNHEARRGIFPHGADEAGREW